MVCGRVQPYGYQHAVCTNPKTHTYIDIKQRRDHNMGEGGGKGIYSPGREGSTGKGTGQGDGGGGGGSDQQ